jgi:hypothetical protein
MTQIRLVAAASTAALFLLAGCQSEPVKVGEAVDPQAEALKNAPPVKLPPAIKEAKTYRCKDNSLVNITFMNDNVTAEVRDKEEAPPRATLKASAPGQPFEGTGYTVTGSGNSVSYKTPTDAAQTCRSN